MAIHAEEMRETGGRFHLLMELPPSNHLMEQQFTGVPSAKSGPPIRLKITTLTTTVKVNNKPTLLQISCILTHLPGWQFQSSLKKPLMEW
jgi:hypothetical protein